MDAVVYALAKKAQKSYKGYYLADVDVNEAVLDLVNSRRLNIDTYTDGFCQVETATAAGTVTADPGGNATVTVKAAGMTNSPKDVTVPLLLNDDANAIALAIRTALAADADVSEFFTVSGETDKVILTAKAAADNDSTMNIAIATGTATGVTAVATSTNTTRGSLNEIVHPSILFFPNGWNGYKYWLGYTCFDNGLSQYENPCIAVSNDNVNWTTPPGLTNPVEPQPEAAYYADINLFMSPDEKTMYMVFKHSAGTKTTYLRSSSDGVNWTDKVALFSNAFEDVSPTVVWDGAQYKMWTIKHDDTPNNIYLRTATNATGPWSAPSLCTYVLPANKEPWHIEVRKIGNQYHAVVQVVGNTALYFGKSENGIDFTFGSSPIVSNTGYLYKPTMFPMQTETGLKYGFWRGVIGPYSIHYSELLFNKSDALLKASNEASLNLLLAKNGIEPWIFCDTFNRADDATGLGTSDSGHVWTAAMATMGISSGKAYVPAATNTRAIVDIGVADFYMEAIFSVAVYGTQSYLLFRYAGWNNWWRFGQNNNKFVLQKSVGGTITSIPVNFPNGIVSGDRIGCLCNGSNIGFYKNGVLIASITDAAMNTATKIGLNMDNTTTRFDNFIARTL